MAIFSKKKTVPAATAPLAKGKTPISAAQISAPARSSPTPSTQASFTSSVGPPGGSAAWPTSPEAPRSMDSHGLIPSHNRGSFKDVSWDQVGSYMASGQQQAAQAPSAGSGGFGYPQAMNGRPTSRQSASNAGPPPVAPIDLNPSAGGVSSPQSESSSGGFKSIFGRGKGKHAKNQSLGGSSQISAGSAGTVATVGGGMPRSNSMTSGVGSDAYSSKKGHASKPSASSYFSSTSSSNNKPPTSRSNSTTSKKEIAADARSISSVNTTFSAVSSLHPGASIPPPPLPTNSASFAPVGGNIKTNQGPPVRVRVFIDHPTTEPLYVTVVPGVETLRSFKHKILKTDNDRFIQFRQARRPPVETRWDISDSPFDDPKTTGFDMDERIQLFRVSVNWLVVSKTKRAFEKTRTFTSILSCCPSTPILSADPNSLLDLGALFPPSVESTEARLKGLIEIVVRITPRQSIPVLVSFSDMPDHPIVVDVERGMTVRDVKETIGESRTLIVRPVGGVQNGLENSDFYLFKCAQPCHKGPLPFDIDHFEGLSPETLFDDESELFEQSMFIERTGWDQPQISLERVEMVAFLTDDMEDDFRDSLRMHTKQGAPSVRSGAGVLQKAPAPQTTGMSPAKAYASQQRPSPQRGNPKELSSAAGRKEDRHRSMPAPPRQTNGGSPRSQNNLPPQASPQPRNKHLSHQPPPRDYKNTNTSPQNRTSSQQDPRNNVSNSSSVPNLAAINTSSSGSRQAQQQQQQSRNVPRINGTYSPVNMVSPSSSPRQSSGGPFRGTTKSPRQSPSGSPSSKFATTDSAGGQTPKSPLADDDASVYDDDQDDSTSTAVVSNATVHAAGGFSTALINGLSSHKRSTELDPLELSSVNEGLGLDDILQGYNARSSVDSLGLTMSRKPTVDEGADEGRVVVEDLGETIDRKLSKESVYEVVNKEDYLAAPDQLNVKLRQPFVGPKHGGFAAEDLSPMSAPVPLPDSDTSPRSSESGPPSYQTNSGNTSLKGTVTPPLVDERPLAPSPSSEKTVQPNNEVDGDVDDSRDYVDEDEMSERAITPDAPDDDDEDEQQTDGQHQDGASADETRSLRFASIGSSSQAPSVMSPTRGKFYHTASNGGRRSSYFNRTAGSGYPLRSAMKGSKAQARAAGELPPVSPNSPARLTFRRPVNTKVANRISRDFSNAANRLSHLTIYQGKVRSNNQNHQSIPIPPVPESASPLSEPYSPRSFGSEDLSRKNSLGLVAEGYALIGGALFAVSLKPMDERGAAVMKSQAFQQQGPLWNVSPGPVAPSHHGTSF